MLKFGYKNLFFWLSVQMKRNRFSCQISMKLKKLFKIKSIYVFGYKVWIYSNWIVRLYDSVRQISMLWLWFRGSIMPSFVWLAYEVTGNCAVIRTDGRGPEACLRLLLPLI